MYIDAAHRILTVEGKEAFDRVLPLDGTWQFSCLGSETCLWKNSPWRKNYTKQNDVEALFRKHVDFKKIEKEIPADSNSKMSYIGMGIMRPPKNVFNGNAWIAFMLEGENQDCKTSPQYLYMCQDESMIDSIPNCNPTYPYKTSYNIKHTEGNFENSGNTFCVVPIILMD